MPDQTTRRELLLAALILVGGAAWRLHGLSAESYWTDEVAAVLVARRSLLEILFTIGVQDVSPPLFYFLLHPWLWVCDAEAWTRLLPALLGLVTIALNWRLARRWGGPAVGLLAALFAAFSPLCVYLSRELRYHTLVAALVLAAAWAATRVIESRGETGRRALALFLILGLYTHYYFLLMPLVVGVWLWLAHREDPLPWRRVLTPVVVALLAFMPWLFFLLVQAQRDSYRFRPLTLPLAALFDLALYGTLGHADGWGYDRWPGTQRLWVLPALLPFFVAPAVALWRRRTARVTRFAAVGLFVPLFAVLSAGLWWPIHGPRYFLPFLPFFFILQAVGLQWLWRPRVKALPVALALVLLVLMTGSTVAQRLSPAFQREDWRALPAFVDATRRESPAALWLTYNKSQAGPLAYYWTRQFETDLPQQPLLTGDPFSFGRESKDEIAARVRLYRASGATRFWLLDHYAHLYDPAGHVRAALDEQLSYAPALSAWATARFRLPLRGYLADPQAIIRDAPRRLDFSPGRGIADSPVVTGDWSHLADEWAWLGRSGAVYLRADEPAAEVRLRVWRLGKYLDGATVRLSVEVPGQPPAVFEIDADEPRELTVPLAQGAPVLAVRLDASPTFDPAVKIGGGDHSPKSLLVDWIEVR